MTRYAIPVLLLALMLALAPAPARPQPGPTPGATPAERLIDQEAAEALRRGEVLLNYENIDIRVLAKLMAELTGRNILLDDRVAGRVTVISSRPVPLDEAWRIFKTALQRYSFSVVERDGYVQILPTVESRRTSPVYEGTPPANGRDMVLAILIVRRGNAESIQNVVRPLVSEVGFLSVYKEGNALIIAERPQVLARIAELVRSLDRLAPGGRFEVLYPRYAEADKLAPVLNQVLAGQEGLKIQAFAPANAIVVVGTAEQIARVKALVARLDLPQAAAAKIEPPQWYVVHLQNSQADQVAKILSEMLAERRAAQQQQQQQPGGAAPPSPVPTPAPGSVPTPSRNRPDVENPVPTYQPLVPSETTPRVPFVSSRVSSDPDTNALILYLSPSEYQELLPVITRLDLPRKQVLISAVVAEVSLSRALEQGVRWQVISSAGVIGAFNAGVTEEGLLSFLASGNFLVGAVSNQTETINVGGRDVKVPRFFAMISALQRDSDFNLISAPRVLTQDHKEAVMNVGQVVPFPTGARFDTFGNPLITFDYKDVGIKLKVTPHVSQNNSVRMELEQQIQEVTELLTQSIGGVGYSVPIVSNRNVSTTVTIQDGQTLLIGGLISKRTLETMRKVPILGDLPLIAPLFRETSKEEKKSTIFISLTPMVVETPRDIEKLDQPYEEFLHGEQNPGDSQTENRNTREPDSELPGNPPPPAESPTPRPSPLVPPTSQAAPQVQVEELRLPGQASSGSPVSPVVVVGNPSAQEVDLVLTGTVTRPDGGIDRLAEARVHLAPGQRSEISLPHYTLPDSGGVYEFDVAARVDGKVVGRLPAPRQLQASEPEPPPPQPVQIR